MNTHPSLSYFGETRSRSFPLLLVIGREPNTELEIDEGIGPYDFRDHYPKGKFWDNAYGVLAEAAGLSCRQLKDACIRSNSSPIIFGNSLPIGINGKTHNKRPNRRLVTREKAARNIRNIFSQKELISRTQLTLASGLDDDVFKISRETIVDECHKKRKHLISIPYLYGGNRPKIRLKLTDDWAKLQPIVRAFLEHINHNK